jgi:hypothetical protein
MKKGILIIDWILFILTLFLIISKIMNLSFNQFIQPIFLILILVHIIQHCKIFIYSINNKK